MSKIIKLDGEDVLIGTDDGKIRKVKIYDVHFAPAEGDEVDIYESDGEIIVTKKEVSVEHNYSEQPNTYCVQNNKNDTLLVFLYISMVTSIIACFLPLLSISFLGLSYSVNYVYNEGKIADGIFIIVIQILAIIMISRKKKTATCVIELFTIPIVVYTMYNLSVNFTSSIKISIYNFLDIGFYLLIISLVISIILSSIYAIKK